MTDYNQLMQKGDIYPLKFQEVMMRNSDSMKTAQAQEAKWRLVMTAILLSNHQTKDEVLMPIEPDDDDEAIALMVTGTNPRAAGVSDAIESFSQFKRKLEIESESLGEPSMEPPAKISKPDKGDQSPFYYPMSPIYEPMSPTYNPVSPQYTQESEYMSDSSEDEPVQQIAPIMESRFLRSYRIIPLGVGEKGLKNQNDILAAIGLKPLKEQIFYIISYEGSSEETDYSLIFPIYVHLNPVSILKDARRLSLDSAKREVQMKYKIPSSKMYVVICDIDGYNYDSDVTCPGKENALDFLARRMRNIADEALDSIDDYDILKITENDYFNAMYDNWKDELLSKFEQEPENLEKKFARLEEISKGINLTKFTLSMFLEQITPFWLKQRDIEKKAPWKGKVLPTNCTIKSRIEQSKDFMIINEWKVSIGNLKFVKFINWEHEKREIMKDHFLDFWSRFSDLVMDSNELGTISSKSKDKSRVRFKGIDFCDRVFGLLGIGSKKTVFDDDPLGTTQPPVKDLERMGYGDWIEDLIFDLKEETPYDWNAPPTREMKINPSPIDEISEMLVLSIDEMVRRKQYQCFRSKITNFYSRLGGPYSIGKAGQAHSKINIMPLLMNPQPSEGESIRLCDGICVLGPLHARNPTDKRMFFTIEEIDYRDAKNIKFIDNALNKSMLFRNDNSRWFVVRQNAVQKVDPAYLTYTQNSFFLTCNSIGEIIFRKLLKDSNPLTPEQVFNRIRGPLLESKSFILNLEIELLLMAIIGCSQEEALLSALRMLFMNAIQWSLGNVVYVPTKDSISKSIKESLINSNYALYKFHTFYNSLRLMSDALEGIDSDFNK